MFKWLHHLFNPHCPECQLAAIESKVCESCETLKMQIAAVNAEKRQMLETIMSLAKPAEVHLPPPSVNLENIAPKNVTWNVRRQMLEAEDRNKAQILSQQRRAEAEARKLAESARTSTGPVTPISININDREQSIEQLEKELGIGTEAKTNA